MPSSFRRRKVFAVVVLILLAFSSYAVAKKAKAKKAVPATKVMWREPQDINSRDLFLGPGGESMKPDLRRVTLIKVESGGHSKSIGSAMPLDASGWRRSVMRLSRKPLPLVCCGARVTLPTLTTWFPPAMSKVSIRLCTTLALAPDQKTKIDSMIPGSGNRIHLLAAASSRA